MRFKAIAACVLVVLATVAALPPARADEDFNNTEHLLKWCKEPEASANHALCLGFVHGVAEMMGMVGVGGQGDFRMAMGMCAPDPPPSANAEVQVFINWAEKNPKHWGQANLVGVTIALRQTWPCPADGKAAK